MKKLLLVMLVSLLAFGFVACSSDELTGDETPFYLQGLWTPSSTALGDVIAPITPGRYTSYLITPNQITMFRQSALNSANINDTYKTEFRYLTEKDNVRISAESYFRAFINSIRAIPESTYDAISVSLGASIWNPVVSHPSVAPTVAPMSIFNAFWATIVPSVEVGLKASPANPGAVSVYNAVSSAYNTFMGVFAGVEYDSLLTEGLKQDGASPLTDMITVVDLFSDARTLMAGRMSFINLTNSEEDVVINFIYGAENIELGQGQRKVITKIDIKNRDLYWQNWKAIPYLGIHTK